VTPVEVLTARHVEFIPEKLERGLLYVSERYATAAHLCCCGCGREVVTPLNASKWRLTEVRGQPSLWPSVGNWSFACRSHYWIDQGKVRWAPGMSAQEVQMAQARDAKDATLHSTHVPWWRRFINWLLGIK